MHWLWIPNLPIIDLTMDREQALAIVKQYVKAPGLINHMLSVEAVLRYYAAKLNEDVDLWGITGFTA